MLNRFRAYLKELRSFDPEVAFIIAYATLVLLVSIYLPRTRLFFPREPFLSRLVTSGLLYLLAPTIPMVVFRRTPIDYGVRLGDWKIWVVDLIIMLTIMIVVMAAVFPFTNFRNVYPLWRPAARSPALFLSYQGIQLFHMTAWEYFFRGFMLFGLSRKIDRRLAILIQTIPFAIMHFRKPALEAYASILAGIFLGILSTRGRSFLPSALLHFGVALCSDVIGLLLT